MSLPQEFEHLKISLEEIKLATNNFCDDNYIGKGGFGHVYKGELSLFKRQSIVAIKRLDRRLGQGNPEFWKEIMMLSRYKHENLISLLGFCDEGSERILVYEHASHRSLDYYLSNSSLTWLQRLRICVGAARGLEYLHNPKGTQQRVLHRDIKSSNILLDENWKAKVSDFGLSKIGPANQEWTIIVTSVAGTFGYCDPLYMETGILTKESDVYSFGVVLFEVLCGRLCYEKHNGELQTLVTKWKHSYEQDKLEEIIYDNLRKQILPDCLDKFSTIAYGCLRKDRKERPTMTKVVEELEIALDFQEGSEDLEPPNYEEILKMAEPAIAYGTKEEVHLLLSAGVMLNNGKTWFSWKNDVESCELISATKFDFLRGIPREEITEPKSRFATVMKVRGSGKFTAKARTQFLTRGSTYAISLVLDYCFPGSPITCATSMRISTETLFADILYHQKTTKKLKACLAYRREDGWLTVDLYQFTAHRKKVDFEISFQTYDKWLLLEGIEFRRIQAGVEETEILDDSNNIEMTLTSKLDSDWEKKSHSDYRNIIKRAVSKINCTNEKDLYLLLSKGILIKKRSSINKLYWGKGDSHQYQWFSLDENGRKCLMLQSKTVMTQRTSRDIVSWSLDPNSRFQVVGCIADFAFVFNIHCEIESRMLSPETRYACYLVYKQVHNSYYEMPLLVKDTNHGSIKLVYLKNPTTPVIRIKHEQRYQFDLTHVPKSKMKGFPEKRKDGWMEVQVWEFETGDAFGITIPMALMFCCMEKDDFFGLTVEGIEFRPIKNQHFL